VTVKFVFRINDIVINFDFSSDAVIRVHCPVTSSKYSATWVTVNENQNVVSSDFSSDFALLAVSKSSLSPIYS